MVQTPCAQEGFVDELTNLRDARLKRCSSRAGSDMNGSRMR